MKTGSSNSAPQSRLDCHPKINHLGRIVSIVRSAKGVRTKPVSVGDMLGRIKTGKYQAQIENIRKRHALAIKAGQNGKDAVGMLKEKLPAVMWSGEFKTRSAKVPLAGKLLRHSGIICADLDDIPDRLTEVRGKLTASPHIIGIFVSPTGTGLKALFQVPPKPETHKASFEAVRKHVLELTGCEIDPACKDVTRLCFVSFDPDTVIKADAVAIPISKECTEETEETEATEETKETEVMAVSAWLFQIRTIAQAVERALPDKPHQNNDLLFVFARAVKSLEAQNGQFTPEQHREAFECWYDRAKPFLRPDQTKEDYFMEYLHAYSRAKYPLGSAIIPRAWKLANEQPLPPEASQFENPQCQLLVALCRQLQRLNGNEPFYLSTRTCQVLFGHDSHTTAWMWLNALCVLKIIKKVKAGTVIHATRFRYLCSVS